MRSVLLHQRNFRVLLRALSRPGTRCSLPTDPEGNKRDILRAVLETLLDIEVTFALAAGEGKRLSEQEITGWTHAQAAAPEEADFLIVVGPESGGALERLQRGSPEAPDSGATAIFWMAGDPARNHSHIQVRLSGPGVDPDASGIAVLQGVSARELEAIRRVNADFPCGIDCFFLYPDGGVVGLPRSVVIEEA
ncbi:MAG: phosphonate C-P lyase system protein PhnH [Desulfobacteraceae bacterium]|nr:phosphonate C-P lyase system protein PhnH [Desulfobacteraceae bacterium]